MSRCALHSKVPPAMTSPMQGTTTAQDISLMAKHADKEANPLYPVPSLMNAKELEEIYYKVADWS